MGMNSITGSPLWKVLSWLAIAFFVITSLTQLWNMNSTWFLITFLQQLWSWAVQGIEIVRGL